MSDENGATVEWGSPAAERVNGRRWWPRLPVRTGGGDRRGRRTISPVALACAVVGFGLTLAAELLLLGAQRLVPGHRGAPRLVGGEQCVDNAVGFPAGALAGAQQFRVFSQQAQVNHEA